MFDTQLLVGQSYKDEVFAFNISVLQPAYIGPDPHTLPGIFSYN